MGSRAMSSGHDKDHVGVPHWENPRVFEINRLRAHVPMRCFRTKDIALAYYTAGSGWRTHNPKCVDLPHRRYLNGRWRFHLAPSPGEIPFGFWGVSYGEDEDNWTDIEVPGNIETQRKGSILSIPTLCTLSAWTHRLCPGRTPQVATVTRFYWTPRGRRNGPTFSSKGWGALPMSGLTAHLLATRRIV